MVEEEVAIGQAASGPVRFDQPQPDQRADVFVGRPFTDAQLDRERLLFWETCSVLAGVLREAGVGEFRALVDFAAALKPVWNYRADKLAPRIDAAWARRCLAVGVRRWRNGRV